MLVETDACALGFGFRRSDGFIASTKRCELCFIVHFKSVERIHAHMVLSRRRAELKQPLLHLLELTRFPLQTGKQRAKLLTGLLDEGETGLERVLRRLDGLAAFLRQTRQAPQRARDLGFRPTITRNEIGSR